MTKSHKQEKTITELAYYPKHTDREASEEYRKNHNYLVHARDEPCIVCGSRENRETHHYFEWSEWNAIDESITQDVYEGNHWLSFDPYGFGELLEGNKVKNPDDIRNLVVLCRKCHRETETGFHETTGPLWIANDASEKKMEILNKDYEK